MNRKTVKLTAASAPSVRAPLSVQTGVKAGLTIKQKVTENAVGE